jgi:hypothetical protein
MAAVERDKELRKTSGRSMKKNYACYWRIEEYEKIQSKNTIEICAQARRDHRDAGDQRSVLEFQEQGSRRYQLGDQAEDGGPHARYPPDAMALTGKR